MTVQIRDAAVGDSSAIAELLTSLGYAGSEPFIEDKVRQLLCHPEARLLVAEEDSCVLGFISLHFIPQVALRGDFCRISYLCVAENARGKGIGVALENEAVALARRRACDRLEVHCQVGREAARRFYDRQGYTESPKYLVKSLRRSCRPLVLPIPTSMQKHRRD